MGDGYLIYRYLNKEYFFVAVLEKFYPGNASGQTTFGFS